MNPASGPDNTDQILSGVTSQINPDDAVCNLNVATQGNYKLWARFYHYIYDGYFTLEVYQDALLKQSLTINTADSAYGPTTYYVWDSLDVQLDAGPVEIRITRPENVTSWTARRLDVLFLTNDLDYSAPNIQDFLIPVYVRFNNTSTNSDPFCLYGSICHDVAPVNTTVGIISKAGESRSFYVPGYSGTGKDNMWIATGESTPWIRITSYIKRGRRTLHKNRIHFIATRARHVEGFVTEPIEGTLEFAIGDDRQIISTQTISIDQDGARMYLTTNGDIASHPDEILSAWEYYNASRTEVDTLMEIGPDIAHIDMSAGLSLYPHVDDYVLFGNEVNMLKDMGFNNLYTNGPGIDKLAYGLLSESGISKGLLYKRIDGCYNQPDTTAIDSILDTAATEWVGKVKDVTRNKDGDELTVNTLEHIVEHTVCQTEFPLYLQALGLSLSELQIKNWSEAVPISHANREAYPVLYYYTHMFRFDSFRKMANLCQSKLTQRFPNALNYNNYPNVIFSRKTLVTLGIDLYSGIRNGLGMGCTEDWLGYGAGPMQGSYMYSMMRVACAPEKKPFGVYSVGISPSARTKLYEILSSGAKMINIYNYGPSYASVDDWSLRTDWYSNIMPTLTR